MDAVDALAVVSTAQPGAADADVLALGAALRRLDGLIARRIAAADAAGLAPPATDALRGLHIGPEDVRRWLQTPPGEAPGWAIAERADEEAGEESNEDANEGAAAAGLYGAAGTGADSPLDAAAVPRFAWLARAFGLSGFDLDLLLIALAPEVDLRYEGLYAYLQDDVARRRPSVELALSLLCPTLAQRLARRAHFAADAPLQAQGLLHLAPAPGRAGGGLLALALQPDAQAVDVLLGQGGLDARLAGCCRAVWPRGDAYGTDAGLCLDGGDWVQLQRQAQAALAAAAPLRVYLQGPPGSGRRRVAAALAGALGRPLLALNLAHAPQDGAGLRETLRLACREAWLTGALLLVLEDPEAPDAAQAEPARRLLREALAGHGGVALVAGSQPWVPDAGQPLGLRVLRLVPPDVQARRRCWQRELALQGLQADEAALAVVAARLRLWPGQVRDAVLSLADPAAGGEAPADGEGVPAAALLAAARRQCGHRLEALARRIEPMADWDALVLPPDALAQLHELCARAVHGPRVLEDWGFGARLSQGKGLTALFAGPSGTGKTMAAEVVARALGLALFKVDLAGVVSKYIGETEKNLDRVFDAAADANAILFFDEADALFGKRSEVRDAHDRYANLEIAYLLQRMEQYEGVAILATNLRQHLDDAFLRRLAFTVHFPFPEAAERARLWRGMWPASLPLAPDVDAERLAAQFRLSGGHIRNVTLAAACLAARDGTAVGMAHVLHAVKREFQKMGKALGEAELNGTAAVVPLGDRQR